MKFVFNDAKSRSNELKHGITLRDAQKIWEDPDLILGPATSVTEERWAAVGKINSDHWLAVFTYRDDAIRLITCRRTRPEETETYELSKQNESEESFDRCTV